MKIIRSWREQKVMLKWRFPFLCDEDFTFENAQEKESMLKRLSVKLNKSQEELLLIFAELQTY